MSARATLRYPSIAEATTGVRAGHPLEQDDAERFAVQRRGAQHGGARAGVNLAPRR
jgi:hypothetical protein